MAASFPGSVLFAHMTSARLEEHCCQADVVCPARLSGCWSGPHGTSDTKLRTGYVVHNVGLKACLSCTSGPRRGHDVQVPGAGEVSAHRDNKAEGTSTATRGHCRTRGKTKPCKCGNEVPLPASSVRTRPPLQLMQVDFQQCGASCAGRPRTTALATFNKASRRQVERP